MSPERWQQVKRLFDGAVAHAEPERDRFLDVACGTDSALRHEVAALLAVDAASRGFLSTPAAKPSSDRPRALSPGQRLGGYEVVAELGAGGMGEVYRARDLRLGRDVAIKVLPAHRARDPEARARFEAEARAAAALTHPNVVALHGFAEDAEIVFAVTELLEGETLRASLKRGLAPGRAAEIGIEVARGLAAAHDHGIVHRDLKPENLFVCADGRVKILDFGLSKLLHGGEADLGGGLTVPLTTPGQMMGTLPYMPPEQLRGGEVDHRADIFALGVVLYEIAGGAHPFAGASAADTLDAILNRDPPPLPRSPELERVLRRCLAKKPRERFQSARDLAFALEAPPAFAVTRPGRRTLAAGGAALLVVATLGAASRRAAAPVPEESRLRLSVTFPANAELAEGNCPRFALAPDGRTLVYESAGGLFRRALDRFTPERVMGADGGQTFFSPDGAHIGFFGGGVSRLPLAGGTAVRLGTTESSRGGAWADDGSIVFTPGYDSGLRRVPASGGVAEEITHVDTARGEVSHRWPCAVPGGAVVFVVSHGESWADAEIAAQRLPHGERRTLTRGSYPRFVPPGTLLFVRGETLLAAPFDAASLSMGTPRVVLEGVSSATLDNGSAQLDVSASGTLAYVEARAPARRLAWVTRDGRLDPLDLPGRAYEAVAVSPAGDRLAVTVREPGGSGLYVYDLARTTWTRLSAPGVAALNPVWSADGRRLAFAAYAAGQRRAVYVQAGDGSTPAAPTAGDPLVFREPTPTSWAPDGSAIAVTDLQPAPRFLDTLVLPLEGGQPRPLAARPVHNEMSARFSPDGRLVAYCASNELGQFDVYLQPYPTASARWQVSPRGGTSPVWSRDGRELFYRDGARIMGARVQSAAEPRADAPRVVVDMDLVSGMAATPAIVGVFSEYDVDPGGRFLVILPDPRERLPAAVHIVQGFARELAERLDR